MNVAKSIVPAVCVYVVQLNAAASVVVPAPLLITNGPSVVLVFGVIVPVPRIVAVNAVNVPPLDNVKLFKFKLVVPGLNTVVPKFNVLNQLPVAKAITDIPVPVIVMFGELADVPPAVLPKKTALATVAVVVNPPVPVRVNPVAVAISNTVVAAVVCVNAILPVPNDIALVTAPDELNMPVVSVKLAKSRVPLVNVVVPVAVKVNASPNVVAVLVIVKIANVALPLLVIVPVPIMVAVNVVNVPPALNVNPCSANAVVPGLNTVVPKLNVLKILPVVNVCTAVPLPVNVKFGALVDAPPVVPNSYVLVIDASETKPPVPVKVR